MEEATVPSTCCAERGCGGGLDKHNSEKGVALQQHQLRGMEGEAALEMAFIQQWGRGWLVQVQGQCPGGLLPAGGLRMVEHVETSSWQQTYKTASPGRLRSWFRGSKHRSPTQPHTSPQAFPASPGIQARIAIAGCSLCEPGISLPLKHSNL